MAVKFSQEGGEGWWPEIIVFLACDLLPVLPTGQKKQSQRARKPWAQACKCHFRGAKGRVEKVEKNGASTWKTSVSQEDRAWSHSLVPSSIVKPPALRYLLAIFPPRKMERDKVGAYIEIYCYCTLRKKSTSGLSLNSGDGRIISLIENNF